jgi:hypothetical protein
MSISRAVSVVDVEPRYAARTLVCEKVPPIPTEETTPCKAAETQVK